MNARASIRENLLIGLAALMMLAGLSVWMVPEAYACSCVSPPPPQEAKEQSVEVFTGEVIDISDGGTDDLGAAALDVHLRVTEAWKGIDQLEVTVQTPEQSAACGFNFAVGEEYLVYTYETGKTNLCSRTAAIADAGEDLEALGEGTPGSELDPAASDNEVDSASDTQDDGLNPWYVGGGFAVLFGVATGVALVRRWR